LVFNTSMEILLKNVRLQDVRPKDIGFIWMKHSPWGKYWGIGDFWGLDQLIQTSDYDLMDLEWQGNELYINDTTDVSKLLLSGLETMATWKKQMETDYSETPFDIILSLDEGDEDVPPSITLRFWAVRNHSHYIIPAIAELDGFSQPVLMEQVNYEL